MEQSATTAESERGAQYAQASTSEPAALSLPSEASGRVIAMAGVTKPYLLPKESPLHIPPHVVMARIDDDVEHLKTQIRILQERNFIKDKGKKFEGSYTRVSFIMLITYGTISAYMYLIGVQDPLLVSDL